MNSIFEIATKLSTPLALAGFLAAIFFFITKRIIEKKFFPTLSKNLSSDIIKLIFHYMFILSLTAMILGFISYFIPIIYSPQDKKIVNVNEDKSEYKPTIVLMDSPLQNVVYDRTNVMEGRTNADEISEILDDLNVHILKETTNINWNRDKQLSLLNPDLIIIHYSCFYPNTNPEDTENKFKSFLRSMAETKSQFLIYTRAPDAATENDRKFLNKHFEDAHPSLKNRIHFFGFDDQSPPYFKNIATARRIKEEVIRILKLKTK